MFKRIVAAAIIFGMAAAAPPANAQFKCAHRTKVIDQLQKHDEVCWRAGYVLLEGPRRPCDLCFNIATP